MTFHFQVVGRPALVAGTLMPGMTFASNFVMTVRREPEEEGNFLR